VHVGRLLRLSISAVVVSLVAVSAPAFAGTTLYTPWSSVLPGWDDHFTPGSDNTCAAGDPSCLTVTLDEQLHILTPNAQSCSHLAIFPLAYVRMTQTYGWTRDQPGYYHDVPYMNHMDAVFARYYRRPGCTPSTPPRTRPSRVPVTSSSA
jgi:hypothetical protein